MGRYLVFRLWLASRWVLNHHREMVGVFVASFPSFLFWVVVLWCILD